MFFSCLRLRLFFVTDFLQLLFGAFVFHIVAPHFGTTQVKFKYSLFALQKQCLDDKLSNKETSQKPADADTQEQVYYITSLTMSSLPP